MKTVRETWLIYRRSLVLTLRQPVWLLMGIFQPILYLVLFGPLLEGAVTQAPPRHGARTTSPLRASSIDSARIRAASAGAWNPAEFSAKT